MSEIEIIAKVELIRDGKKKLLGITVHAWSALCNRAGGFIRVEGHDGSYVVLIFVDGSQPREVYRGGLEHALRHAWTLAAKYRANGCADV